MENYEKQSYNPERLDIGCNGSSGLNGEPWSLVVGDMMKQNIMIVAYERPVTPVEIAKALGIPAAYIEGAVSDLIRSELMASVGGRVYTDFMLTTPEERLRGLDAQIALVDEHYEPIREIIENYLFKIRGLPFYRRLRENEQKKLDHYFVLHLFSSGIYAAAQRILPSKDEFPQRPDGGAWVAQGFRFSRDFDFDNYKLKKYSYGGERRAYWENVFGAKSICLHIYDTQPDLNKYQHSPVEMRDEQLAKLLCLIHKGIPLGEVGFDLMYLKNIPHLVECSLLEMKNNKPHLAIPVITKSEYKEANEIRRAETATLSDCLEPAIRKVLPELKIEIPKHLEGRVAPLRQHSFYAIPMVMLKKAISEGDGGIVGAAPPMVFVIEERGGGKLLI